MILATIPALAALVGVLMYALSANPKLAEIGRLLFFAGIFVVLLALQGAGAVRIP
jgi:hypothetical protein